ncbi:MAG: helix-turn-helix transcriptional regulator [Phycisphaeraceae bacterium]
MRNVLTIEGKEYAVIPMEEYRRLTGANLPSLPQPNAQGTRPAREAIRTTLARSVITKRLAAGLTQKELAQRAGISAETLSRIESAKHRPQAATLERIAAALGE